MTRRGRNPLPDSERRVVEWRCRLRLRDHEYLLEKYPEASQDRAAAIEALIRDRQRMEPELQRAALESRRRELADLEARVRESEDREREEAMQAEEEDRRAELERDAIRARTDWHREHGQRITSWVNQAMADPDADPVAFIESLRPPDEVARARAIQSAVAGLERRKKQERSE